MTFAQAVTYRNPWTERFGDVAIDFRMMTPDDYKPVCDFTSSLPESELIFVRLDISKPEVVCEWAENVRAGRTTTILAERNGRVVGYGSLHTQGLHWTRHQGEIRLMVSQDLRGKGIGHTLIQSSCDVGKEKGLELVVAQIAANQPRVRRMFESLGFAPAALLTDWLKDRYDKTHDLVVMSRNLKK